MKPTIAATALALLFITAPAVAEQTTPPFPAMASFDDFDADGDGFIAEQEFIEARNKRIAERAAEGRPMRGLSQAEEFKDIDADGDTRISREEFAAHQRRHLESRPRYSR